MYDIYKMIICDIYIIYDYHRVEEDRTSERCERDIYTDTKPAEQIRRNHEHVARREAG